MTEVGQVYKAFNQFQSSMTAIKKGDTNPRFNSSFAGFDSVAKVADGMYKFDLSWTQRIESNESEDFVITEIMHSDGSKLKPSIMRLYFNKKTISNDGKPVATMQQFISAVTYARRTSLMAICGMSTNDKDGNDLSEDLNFENEDEENEFNLQQDTSSNGNSLSPHSQKKKEASSPDISISGDGAKLTGIDKDIAECKDHASLRKLMNYTADQYNDNDDKLTNYPKIIEKFSKRKAELLKGATA
tara:strand:+ start:456 stop:1187 length:732 start_codon:yes stop_codon:yes gene_type:complete